MEMTRRKLMTGPRYLNFVLGDESYGIEIKKVKELMGMTTITPIPQTPPFIRGFINLRGQIIPIVDLRLKFGLPFREYTKRTSIIVVEVPFGGETLLMGLVVDSIRDVASVPDDKVNRVPYINAKVHSEYIIGVANLEGGAMVILDVVKILNSDEFVQLKGAEETGALQAQGERV
ncbi:MAG TPA: chemotaxis protein CheW [Spirochaetia bacterium]|nr:chemotaxis protein CheW [Spirochaetia bacterium]